MKNFRFLPALLIAVAGIAFASPTLASSHNTSTSHKATLHTTSVHHAAKASTDDPVPPKPKHKPQHGHHRKHPPHPAG